RGPRGAADQRAVRRAVAPRVRGAGAALAAMTALVGLWLVLQGGSGGWTATPARPTVGDTVWLERQVVVPAGWRVRAGRLEAAAGLGGGTGRRRRAPQAVPRRRALPGDAEVPEARWRVAGEARAVGARATFRLRLAVARAIPEARPALSTAECLAVVERARPHFPVRELRELLEQLDRVAFASAHGTDVAALARMARRFAQEMTR